MSPTRLVLHVLKILPLSVRSASQFIKGSAQVVQSYVYEGGGLYNLILEQAFYYERLKIVAHVLKSRAGVREVPLSSHEQKLLTDIQQLLARPELAPRSDAVAYVQSQIYQAETLKFFSEPTKPEEQFVRAHDFNFVHFEAPEHISGWRKAWQWVQKKKLTASLTAALIVASGVGAKNIYDEVAFYVVDKPSVAYGLAKAKTHLNQLIEQVFSKNVVQEQQAQQARRNFTLTNDTINNVLDEFFAKVRHRRRKDPSYNYLTDPVYQQQLDEVFNELLDSREQRAAAAQFAHARHRLLEVIVPRKILTTMGQAYKQQYPQHEAQVDEIFKLLAQSKTLGQSEKMLPIVHQYYYHISEPLFRDLLYFVTEGYEKAYVHYYDKNFGVLVSSQGGPYESFGKRAQPLIR